MLNTLKRKLTSRKLWVAVIGFVTAISVAFNVPEDSISHIVSTISAFATLIAYIIGEGIVDSKGGDSNGGE